MVHTRLLHSHHWHLNTCRQEVATCFTSASVANRLAAMCFLRGLNVENHWAGDRDCGLAPWPATRPVYNMGPSDFRIFGPRKKHLAGKRFATDAEVKQAVTCFPKFATYLFYALVLRWDKCLNANGDNAEVWCVPCAIHVTCVLRSNNKVIGVGVCIALRFVTLSYWASSTLTFLWRAQMLITPACVRHQAKYSEPFFIRRELEGLQTDMWLKMA
jgi:hypothetical protein